CGGAGPGRTDLLAPRAQPRRDAHRAAQKRAWPGRPWRPLLVGPAHSRGRCPRCLHDRPLPHDRLLILSSQYAPRGLGPIPPFLLQTDDNPEGVPQSVFDGLMAAIRHDRYAYFKEFFDNFYNVDKLGGSRISDEAWRASFQVAVGASAYATLACVPTWLTDFRGDLPKIG